MVLLPIVDRELRVASRRGWTYWGRVAVALVALVLLYLTLAATTIVPSGVRAQSLFQGLSMLCFGFALVAGTLFSADSLARERREGTLGLLFLTDLRGLDVTLGKLVGTGLGSLYCLVAVMPLLAVPLLLGGVTGWDFLRVVAMLLATLWLSLTTGLLASTLARHVRSAGVGAGVLMALACAGIPLGATLWRQLADWPDTRPTPAWVHGCSPFTAFAESFHSTGGGTSDPTGYLGSLAYTLGLGTLAFVGATRRVPHLWRDKETPRSPGAKGRSADPAAPKPGRRGPPGHPIAWLSNRTGRVRRGPGLVVAAVVLVWALVLVASPESWDESGWILMSLSLHAAFKCWLAAEAPRVFHDARRDGGVELLLTTGLSDADLLHGRLRALGRLCLWPLLVLTAIDIGLGALLLGTTDGDGLARLFWVGHLALLWVDAPAIGITGTWVGARTRGQRAAGATWLRVLALPYLLWILGTILAFIAETQFGIVWTPFQGSGWFLWTWLLLNLAVSAANGAWSYARLARDLRGSLRQPLGPAKRNAGPI